jgi:hypothetical protein
MNAVFDDFVRIARVTTVQRDQYALRVMKVLAALTALALLVGVAIAAARHAFSLDGLFRGTIGLAAFWLALIWATLYVPGSVLLNSPANARLLPRQRRRLMQLTAAGWLVSTLAFATVFDSWATVPLCGLYLIGLPLLLAGHRQAAPFVFLACGWPMLTRTVVPHWMAELVSRPASVMVLSALLLVVGAWALRLLYPAGGDAHMDKRGQQVKRIAKFSARGAADLSEIGGPAGKGVLRVYALAFRRDCRRADPATLLMHALGPAAHWSAWLGAIAAMVLASGGLRLLLAWSASRQVDAAAHAVASVGMSALAGLALFCTAQFSQQMRRTHGEQALLRLTPLAGDAALLNRRLAGGLLKGTLRNWAMITMGIQVAILLAGGDTQVLLRQFALCCLAGQIALLGVLGDYAGEGGWNLMLALRVALLAALEAGVAVGLGWLTGTAVWTWLIAIALVGAVVRVRLGWRFMLAAAPAFPAGRMA